MVLGHVFVDRIGEDAEVAIDEEDDEEGEERSGRQLANGSNLCVRQRELSRVRNLYYLRYTGASKKSQRGMNTHNSACHGYYVA